jgi:hypothetical protein
MGIDYFPLPFRRDEPERVVEHMHEMLRRADGRRWINIRPDLDAVLMAALDRRPSVFSGRGPRIPTATWVPTSINRRGQRSPVRAGITHAQRHDAETKLRQANVMVPEGWEVEQDHPKRGLTFLVPEGDDPLTAVDFLVAASDALSGVIVDDDWVAIIAVR